MEYANNQKRNKSKDKKKKRKLFPYKKGGRARVDKKVKS